MLRPVSEQALDSAGHAAPAWHREPGQPLHRAGLGGAGAARPRGAGRRRRRPGQKAAARLHRGHRPRPRPLRAARLLDRPAPLLVAQRRHLPRAAGAGALDPGGAAAGRDLLRPARRSHGQPRRRRASCWSATSPPPTSWSSPGGPIASGRRSPPSWRRSTCAWPRAATTRPATPRCAANRQAAADRGRPAHAHRPLARLRDAGRGAAGDGPRPRPRRDRDHRPQRGLRGAGGAHASPRRWTTSR